MQKIKRMGSVLLALVMLTALLPVALAETETTAVTEGDYQYKIIDGNAIITDYIGEGGDAVIPATLGGAPVTAIDEFSFWSGVSPESVTIPDSVTVIGEGAFQFCKSLSSIDFGKGVEIIGDYSFYGCESLTELTIPGNVTTIGMFAFTACSSLTSVVLEEGVTTISENAFSDCSSLTSATMPDSLAYVNQSVFYIIYPGEGIALPYNFTIYCNSNTYAHSYAENGLIPYSLMDAQTYIVTFDGGSGSGFFPYVTRAEGGTVTITADLAAAFSLEKYVFAYFLGSDNVKYYVGGQVTVSSDLTLTAKYSKVSVGKVSKPKLSKESGKIRVRYDKVSKAEGYQFVVSTSKSFASGKGGSKSYVGYKKNYIQTCAGKKLKAGTTYYVKIRAYKLDSLEKKVWGSYSSVTSIKF